MTNSLLVVLTGDLFLLLHCSDYCASAVSYCASAISCCTSAACCCTSLFSYFTSVILPVMDFYYTSAFS